MLFVSVKPGSEGYPAHAHWLLEIWCPRGVGWGGKELSLRTTNIRREEIELSIIMFSQHGQLPSPPTHPTLNHPNSFPYPLAPPPPLPSLLPLSPTRPPLSHTHLGRTFSISLVYFEMCLIRDGSLNISTEGTEGKLQ